MKNNLIIICHVFKTLNCVKVCEQICDCRITYIYIYIYIFFGFEKQKKILTTPLLTNSTIGFIQNIIIPPRVPFH